MKLLRERTAKPGRLREEVSAGRRRRVVLEFFAYDDQTNHRALI